MQHVHAPVVGVGDGDDDQVEPHQEIPDSQVGYQQRVDLGGWSKHRDVVIRWMGRMESERMGTHEPLNIDTKLLPRQAGGQC